MSNTIEHMSKSHKELARLLEAERDIVVHLSNIVTSIPDKHISFAETDAVLKNCTEVTANVVSYLNSIGGLEEAIAENLTYVMKEIHGGDDHE